MPQFTLNSFGNRLRALRRAKDLSQAELARLIGRHQTAIGPYERDEYMPARDIIARLAGILDTTPEYLIFGRSPHRTELPVVGAIRSGIVVNEETQGQKTRLLNLKEGQIVLFHIDDDGMAPAFPRGSMAVVSTLSDDQTELHLGRIVLATLQDGRTFLRKLLPSRDREHFDLAALDGSTIAAATIISVRPVLGVLAMEAFSGPGMS
ncbi:MAG: helix-turn-helix transcriptional regulator [Geminicoccaceae bacterium]|nr:helix-turn-helix transcriptional regulator [Geminicoccaceae bacterium]MCB9943778.1 helix-turn-helix transcriptional regulator [Geminicoccaceae bacterium]